MDIFLCGKPTVKAHLCTLLSSACRVGRQEYLGGTPCFCFSIQGVGGCARWLPIGSSYPLDDVCGAVPSAAEHTALKEAFFQPKGKSSTSSDPAPALAPTPSPSPTSSFLPCFPWPWSKCFMWPGWGRSEVDPWSCPQKRLVFQWDESVLVLAGWSRRVEGLIYFIYLGDG